MKKILTVLLALACSAYANAQYLTQSAEGKSSIPLPLNGMGVGIDIGKTEVAFGLNNYGNVLDDKSKFLLGLNLSAKSSGGLANLFSAGEIVPQGDFLGFAGFSVSNNNKILSNYKNSDYSKEYWKSDDAKKTLFAGLKQKTITIVKSSSLNIKKVQTRKSLVDNILSDISKFTGPKEIRDYLSALKEDNDELKNFKKEANKKFASAEAAYKKEYDKIVGNTTSKNPDFKTFLKSQVPIRVTGFLQGGITARSFTRFISLSTPDLSNSFQDTLFRGGLFGVGFNLQVRNFWLGATYSFVAGDNFANLKSKEYTLKTSDTSGNQVLIREKKITAHSGKYSRVNNNQLNVDLVGDFRLSDTSRLLASIYLRGSIFSRDTAYLKNYTNVGAGLYFVDKKGKFLGGLYVELPDINNNAEKVKPANEINIRSPYKKLTFGIVTKFNISSIFSWANRPVNSE